MSKWLLRSSFNLLKWLLIDGVNPMGVVSDPRAVSIIADEVAKSGANS
jgi:hypothetical protein